MRKAYQAELRDRLTQQFVIDVARLFDVPMRILGALPLRDGRHRSQHRHRNRGRA